MNIPKTELERRREVFQQLIREHELDGVLLAQLVSMYYLSGTMQCQYVYVPAEGECIGLVRKNMERARRETDLALFALSGLGGLSRLLEEAGFAPLRRLGLEMDVLPASLYLRLASLFPAAELIDAGNPVREVRQVKSPYELKQYYEAARQVDLMHRSVPGLLYRGKDELELAAEVEAILRKNGHQGLTRMRGFNQEMFFGHILSGESGGVPSFLDSPTGGFGPSPAQPQGSTRRRIAAGEPITVDYGGIHNGYVVDQTRLYSLGPLPAELAEAYSVVLEMQEELKTVLLPGSSGNDIYVRAAAVAARAGLAEYFMGFGDGQARFVGHGVGLEFNEFPILAKGSSHVLGENHVVALEPKFIFPGLGMVGLENTWLVTDRGPVKISITPDDHVIV
jgi:Xaa-Pro aminopeptidase